jgi:hypothetical protein
MLIAPPQALISLLQPWSDFYNDSRLAETLVMFAHTAGLLVAGGIAVATDRQTLRAWRWEPANRRHHLDELTVLHRTVVINLSVTVVSGLLMLASDIETFWGSWIYWTKMGLVVLLLLNGARMVGIEKSLTGDAPSDSPRWITLRHSAAASLVLWLSTTLAGIALLNYA